MKLMKNDSHAVMNSLVKLATFVLATVLITSGSALAASPGIAGKKFNIKNITPFNGVPPCPVTNTNTATFVPGPYNGLVINGTVTVVGNFDGAGFGVCAGTNYGIDPSVVISYEIWDDWVAFRSPGRLATASKVVPINNGFAFIDNGQNFPVSILTFA